MRHPIYTQGIVTSEVSQVSTWLLFQQLCIKWLKLVFLNLTTISGGRFNLTTLYLVTTALYTYYILYTIWYSIGCRYQPNQHTHYNGTRRILDICKQNSLWLETRTLSFLSNAWLEIPWRHSGWNDSSGLHRVGRKHFRKPAWWRRGGSLPCVEVDVPVTSEIQISADLSAGYEHRAIPQRIYNPFGLEAWWRNVFLLDWRWWILYNFPWRNRMDASQSDVARQQNIARDMHPRVTWCRHESTWRAYSLWIWMQHKDTVCQYLGTTQPRFPLLWYPASHKRGKFLIRENN